MRRAHKPIIIAQFLMGPVLIAWPRLATDVINLQPESKLWVDGTSSVRGFQCRATALDAVFQADGSEVTRAVLRGEKAVSGLDLTIAAGQLECGNGTMNAHMRKALKVEANPTITFRLASYELAKAGDTLRVDLTGELTLGGTTKTVNVRANAEDMGDGVLRIAGSHELRMTEFGLKPPTLMLGTLKVHDKVKVGFDIRLTD